MPPSKPFSGRRRSSTAPSRRVSQNATPWRNGRSGFSLRAGKCLGEAGCRGGAAGAPRAEDATRPARRADRRAEIHQRLGEIAGPLLRHQRAASALRRGFAVGQRSRTA